MTQPLSCVLYAQGAGRFGIGRIGLLAGFERHDAMTQPLSCVLYAQGAGRFGIGRSAVLVGLERHD